MVLEMLRWFIQWVRLPIELIMVFQVRIRRDRRI